LLQNCEIFGHRTNPTLFSIFIDDPVDEINELGLGVNIRDSKLSILLYADDIVLVALSEASIGTTQVLYSFL
jgi:hypothetical protein